MPNTTIALSSEVYKETLDAEHSMERIIGHPISFSVVVGILNRKWDGKLGPEDIEYARKKKK